MNVSEDNLSTSDILCGCSSECVGRHPVDVWHSHVTLRHRIFYWLLLLILLWFQYFILFQNRFTTFSWSSNFFLSWRQVNYSWYCAKFQMNFQHPVSVLQIWMWISIFERPKTFIISLLEWTVCLSNAFPPAVCTNDLLKTTPVKFTVLADVLYAKIFLMLLTFLYAISTLVPLQVWR